MNNPVSNFFVAAIFVYLLTISSVWADRILIDDPAQTVTVSDPVSCYRPVDVTVDTAKPSLYDADSTQLQKLSDSVRAMLSFECPSLSSIQLTGLIRGLDEIVYQGEMSKSNNWLVQPVEIIDEDNLSELDFQPEDNKDVVTKRYDDELKQAQLDVTGLHLGMSVEQVSDNIRNTFGVEPIYDAQQGLLTMNAQHCPENLSEVQTQTFADKDLKCLRAWFSDNRVAQLQRLNLIQLVDGQAHQVNKLLINKYGNPLQTNTTQNNRETQMVWRAIDSESGQSSIQEVDASVTMVGDHRVVTNVTLYNTETLNTNDENYAELDLKL